MKDKEDIVANWLPRYTGVPLADFGQHILLTNFGGYLGHFSRMTGAPVVGLDRPMPSATADGITMINFGMGSPNAATMMDLLSAIGPRAVLFLGKCGGLKRKNNLGDGLNAMRDYKERSKVKNGAATWEVALNPGEPIIVGEFVDREREDYLTLMRRQLGAKYVEYEEQEVYTHEDGCGINGGGCGSSC